MNISPSNLFLNLFFPLDFTKIVRLLLAAVSINDFKDLMSDSMIAMQEI